MFALILVLDFDFEKDVTNNLRLEAPPENGVTVCFH